MPSLPSPAPNPPGSPTPPAPIDPAALDTLAATPAALRVLLGGLGDEVVETAADEGWSPKDVVAHLLVSGRLGAVERIRAVVERERPALPGYDEHEELERSGFRARPAGQLLDDFERQRGEHVEWLRGLPAEAFARSGEHSEVGAVTAGELLHHIAYHDQLHLGQLTRMLGARFEPLRGPMRRF